MSATDISLRKRIALELHRQKRNTKAKIHQLSYLFWECTLRCNLACKHCGSDCHKSMSQKDMPLEDFLKTLDTITPHVDPHETMIVITGGEPLLRDDLELCGKELYKREYPWGVVTNGLALTSNRLNRLLDAGLRSMTISLDGLEDTHNAMRGNAKSYENATNAIKLLATKGNDIVYDVVTCVTPNNFSQLEQIKETLIGFGVKRWRVFTVFPIGRAKVNDNLQLPPLQFKQLFDFIKKTKQEGGIELNYGCEGYLGNYELEVRDNFFFCHAGISIGSVLVDGSISACPNLRSNFIQGNIYQNDFMEVWNNRYQVFRDRTWTKRGECAACKSYRYCQGNGMYLRDEKGDLLFCHLKRLQEGERQSK